jgi:hypothetical protein
MPHREEKTGPHLVGIEQPHQRGNTAAQAAFRVDLDAQGYSHESGRVFLDGPVV